MIVSSGLRSAHNIDTCARVPRCFNFPVTPLGLIAYLQDGLMSEIPTSRVVGTWWHTVIPMIYRTCHARSRGVGALGICVALWLPACRTTDSVSNTTMPTPDSEVTTSTTTHPCVAPILDGCNLFGRDLTGAYLEQASLQGADLRGAKLRNIHAFQALFDDALLEDADFTAANLAQATFAKANLLEANLDGANLAMSWFVDANLRSASLIGANGYAIFERARLEFASLDNFAGGGNFRGAKMQGVYGANGDFADSTFDGADLTDADMTNSSFQRATLIGANLSGANFSGADLTYADLTGATVTGAKFTNAKLDGARLPAGWRAP